MTVIQTEDIVTITQSILSTMLQLDAVPVDGEADQTDTIRMTGCVQISGQWRGAVVLQAPEALATIFASRLLMMDAADVTHADLLDAFAEMTNMVGGNIKGQVPSPSTLSIPSVTTGRDFEFHLAGATVVQEALMACEGETMRVLICEGNSDASC